MGHITQPGATMWDITHHRRRAILEISQTYIVPRLACDLLMDPHDGPGGSEHPRSREAHQPQYQPMLLVVALRRQEGDEEK